MYFRLTGLGDLLTEYESPYGDLRLGDKGLWLKGPTGLLFLGGDCRFQPGEMGRLRGETDRLLGEIDLRLGEIERRFGESFFAYKGDLLRGDGERLDPSVVRGEIDRDRLNVYSRPPGDRERLRLNGDTRRLGV